MRSLLATSLLALSAVPLVLATTLHAFTSDAHVLLAAVHAGIGWWLLPAAPLGAIALSLGRRKIAWCCGLVAFAHIGWVAPGHWPVRAAKGGETLSIGSSNLLAVNPTPRALVRELVRLDPDVWCLQELNFGWMELLDSDAIREIWPYRELYPDDSAFGIGLLSKRPLGDVQLIDLQGVPMATAMVDGVALGCVHTLPPRSISITRRWHQQMEALGDWAEGVRGPLILAGDLNATRHHPSYQRLVARAHLHDSHTDVGRASAGSWPAPPYWDLLPWLRLDHVLLSRDLQARVAIEGNASGSDHRPLYVVVQLLGSEGGPIGARARTAGRPRDDVVR